MVTVGEACRELQIARSTFERHMKRLHIKTQRSGIDKRERYITDKELVQIRSVYGVGDKPPHDTMQRGIDATQLDKIIERITLVETQLAQLLHDRPAILPHNAPQGDSDSVDSKEDTTYHPYRSTIARNSDTLPIGYMSLSQFCDMHNIPVTTIKKAIHEGRFRAIHRGYWKVGRAIVRYAVDAEQQAQLQAMFKSRTDEGE